MEITEAHLKHLGTGELMKASLMDDITDDHLDMWKATWLPVIQEYRDAFEAQNKPKAEWPYDLRWNWDAKILPYRGQLGLKAYCIICDSKLQGMMQVNFITHGKLKEHVGKPLVYIDFLSTAPWNRRELVQKPVFGRVGSILVQTAVQLSFDEDFKGRIGLSSLPQSNAFYREAFGMTELGPNANYPLLTDFELTAEQAAKLITS